MPQQSVRQAAVAGSWYPADPARLRREVTTHLSRASEAPDGDLIALIAPHAGLMYSGPVAAHAYAALAGRSFDLVVLVGPSHYVGFDGVATPGADAFETPLGNLSVAVDETQALLRAAAVVTSLPAAHAREHSLEMQLPFLAHLLPGVPIVPLVMGYQTAATIAALGELLGHALRDRRALLVASTDLSHFFDARRASVLDGRVVNLVNANNPEGLLAELERYPEHERGRYVACGGGPAVSVMLAARQLGARDARVLKYGHSGDVSGDNSSVVGYMAAALGRFDSEARPSS